MGNREPQKRRPRPRLVRPGQRRPVASAAPTVRIAKLAELRPDPRNANEGTERGRDMLDASLRKHGTGRSVLADKHGVLIAGNKTHERAIDAGIDEAIIIQTDGTRLVVVQRTDLDLQKDHSAAALAVADNRVGEVGLVWNSDVLQQLVSAGVPLDDLWSEDELSTLLGGGNKAGLTDPDEAPPKRATGIVPGDLFTLGKHRLVCGDSEDPSVVGLLLDKAKPRLMVTDPPYGVNYDPEWRKRAGVNNSDRMGRVANDDRADWTGVWRLFPGDVAYVWHGGIASAEVDESLKRASFEVRGQIIWRKPRIVLSRGHYHWQHEPCFYVVRHGRTAHWAGKRNQSTVWAVTPTVHRCEACGSTEIDSSQEVPSTVWDIEQRDLTGETTHGTQKPVECMARAMRNHIAPVVYEPFAGSGTSIIAAEMLSRSCLAIELDPVYVQQTIDRWEAFTGNKVVKVGRAVPA
jgi:DNA modification methylase